MIIPLIRFRIELRIYSRLKCSTTSYANRRNVDGIAV
jgi:hypothetical protein